MFENLRDFTLVLNPKVSASTSTVKDQVKFPKKPFWCKISHTPGYNSELLKWELYFYNAKLITFIGINPFIPDELFDVLKIRISVVTFLSFRHLSNI